MVAKLNTLTIIKSGNVLVFSCQAQPNSYRATWAQIRNSQLLRTNVNNNILKNKYKTKPR